MHGEMDAVSSLSNGTAYVNPKNVSFDMHASIYVGRNPRQHEQFNHVEVYGYQLGQAVQRQTLPKFSLKCKNFLELSLAILCLATAV